jgi:CheY-like chemotaxis protein
MCPQNASVLIFDDDRSFADLMTEVLEMDGHQVVGTARSIDSLTTLTQDLKEHGVKVDVALLDNHALWKDGDKWDDTVGWKADQVIQETLGEGPTRVATSSDYDPPYGEMRFNKKQGIVGHLGEFVTALPRKES